MLLLRQGGVMRPLAFVGHSVSGITHERVYGSPPNMLGMRKGRASKSDKILVLIRIRMWIYDHFFQLPLTVSLDRGRHRASPRQCCGIGEVFALWAHTVWK